MNGTVARFEMAYTPDSGDRFAFGPPLRTRLPSYAYLAVGLLAACIVVVAYTGSSGSLLFHYVVEGDRHRILGAPAFALILVASAIGTVIRTHMRGVVVNAVMDAAYRSANSRQWEPVTLPEWRGGRTGRIDVAPEMFEGQFVIKREVLPDGRAKLILRNPATGDFSERVR